jgi:tetratricopeptide (TPR) repeat protein
MLVAVIILGAVVLVAAFFVIRAIVAPRRLASINDMIRSGKLPQAIRAAKSILAKDSRNIAARYALARAYLKDNKPELSLHEMRTINEIGVFDGAIDESVFRKEMAELFLQFKQPEEALKELLLLQKLNPGDAETHYLIGNLMADRNKGAQALNHYRKAIEINPRHANARFRLGMLCYRAKQTDEAREQLQIALRISPDLHAANYYLGKLQKDSGEFPAAAASFDKATRDPEYKVKALIDKGLAEVKYGATDKAETDLERAVSLTSDPNSKETLYAKYALAALYERGRKIEPAIDLWEQIYTAQANFRDVAEKLSQYQELRQDDRIKDYLTIGTEEFLGICQAITQAMGLSIRDAEVNRDTGRIIAQEPQSKWRNVRQMPRLLIFLRTTDPIEESVVRKIHEEMRQQNIGRGVVVTSSSFSRRAVEFAQTRPIDLVAREKLQELLAQADA